MSTTLGGIRDFRLLWIGSLLASTASQMSFVTLPLLVLHDTRSPILAGTVGSVSLAATMIALLPGGVISDTVERRRLMLTCDTVSALMLFGLTAAVLSGRAPVGLVLPVAALNAVLSSLYGPASFGLERAVVPAELLEAATARLQARSAAARLAGPAVAGALFAWHPALPFFVQSVALTLSAACLLFVRARSARSDDKAKFSGKELTAGIAFLWRQPYLRNTLLVFGLGMNFAFSATMFVALVVAARGAHFGLGAGTVVSFSAVGALAGTLLAPRLRERFRPGSLIPVACWTCALAAGVLSVRHPVLLMGVVVALCTGVASVGSISFLTTVVTMTPRDLTGRVLSAGNFLSSVVSPLAPLTGGALLAIWGAAPAFAILGSVFAVCAVLVTCTPSMREQPTVSKEPEERREADLGGREGAAR